MLTLQEKQAVVAEVSEIAGRAHSLVAAEYRGLTVSQLTSLREKARQGDVYIRVVKNSLAKRALTNSSFESINEQLTGPIILVFSMNEEDPVSGVRAIHEFLKDKANEKMVVKAIVHDSELYDGSALERIASLPTKDQSISMFLAVLKAPVQKLAATLAAVRDQKEAA